jgi:hypothetical protein
MFGSGSDRSAGQLASCFVEAREHGAVDDIVADLDAQATEELRLHGDVEVDLASVLPAQGALEALEVGVRQLLGGATWATCSSWTEAATFSYSASATPGDR